VAARFGVSEKTIRNQLTLIYIKTSVSSRLELALAAVHTGLAAVRPRP
jgi:DNA-binding CsgD family transcriptional regulator